VNGMVYVPLRFHVLVGSDAKMTDRFYRLSPRRVAGLIATR
jgi:hypothetical protein